MATDESLSQSSKPEPSTVWWDVRNERFALVHADTWQALEDGRTMLNRARTFGEVRELRPPPPVHRFVVSEAERVLDAVDDPTPGALQNKVEAWMSAGFDREAARIVAQIPDDAAWPAETADTHEDWSLLVPWAAQWMEDWLGSELLARHGQIKGGSPGGVDTYMPHDVDGFLEAVRLRGYEPLHRPSLIDEALERI